MTRSLNIGEAADAAGLSAKRVRHYEQIGLLAAPARTDAGYRRYGEREVAVLRFIRQSRRLGFSMAQIADLLGLWGDRGRASRSVKALAQQHLAELEAKLREMTEMKRSLEQLLGACADDENPRCAILDELAAHGAVTPAPVAPAAARPPRSRRPAPKPAPAMAHLGLMAWAHGRQEQHA